LLTPCEVAVKTVSPAIRALLAQRLRDSHKLKETQIAEILGITQSAVSKYSKKVRGTTVSVETVPEVHVLINQMASLLIIKPVQTSQQIAVMRLFCETCSLMRKNGLMCALCKQNQKPKVDGCNFCDSH
jgi:predicted transcriptional regulator